MRGKPSRGLYTEKELKSHKKGKDHIAKELARQESLNDYDQIKVKPIPSHLCYFGKQEWKRVIPLLQQMPIAELDRQMIESYCQLHGFKRRLQKDVRSEEHTSELQSRGHLVCRLLLEKKKKQKLKRTI